MKINTYKLYYKTQTVSFLITMVSIVIAIGLIISTILNSTKKEEIQTKSALYNLTQLQFNELQKDIFKDELAKILKSPNLPMEEFVEFIEHITIINNPKTVEVISSQLDLHSAINPHYQNISLFLKAFVSNDIKSLANKAKSNPVIYLNRLLANYFFYNKDLQDALECLQLEPSLANSEQCKNLLVSLLIQLKKTNELENLETDPHYKLQNDEILKYLSLERNTWSLLFKTIINSQFDINFDGIFFLTLLTGIIWFGIWLHALKPKKLLSTLVLSIIAFALGVFSTSITIFIIYIEEDLFHLSEGTSVIQGLIYFVLGVGLREEFCKLLVFLPLVFILIKRQNPLEWLIIPGIVGLGFATEENLNYFLHNIEGDLAGRFLTANFFHVALTGLVGESICHYFYNRSRGPEHFISTFSMVIIMHGLYDAFISVTLLNSFAFITSIILIYSAFMFFGRIKELREKGIEAISLSTHFIFGLSLLFMSAFIYFSYQGGHFYAMNILIPTIIEMLLIIYLFLYVMPNSIIKT